MVLARVSQVIMATPEDAHRHGGENDSGIEKASPARSRQNVQLQRKNDEVGRSG